MISIFNDSLGLAFNPELWITKITRKALKYELLTCACPAVTVC
jgi:hypothetical protein